MILESHKSINDLYGKWLSIFEAVSIYIFSFEYVYRVYKAYKEGSSNGASKYIFSRRKTPNVKYFKKYLTLLNHIH